MANTKIPAELSSTPSISDGGNATAITIDSSENVGIGTTNPSSGGGLLNLETSSSSVVNYNSTNANGGYIKFQRSGTTKGYVGTPAAFLGGGDADDLGIRAQADFTIATGGANERFRVLSDGNVGIGTASPQQKLHIADGTNGTGLEIRPSDAGANVNINAYDRGQSSYRQMDFGGSVITFATDNGSLAERLRIDSGGVIRARSYRNVGQYCGPNGGVSVADDATLTVTDNTAGALMVAIYEAGGGSGALYFVNYQGDPQLIKQSGGFSFTDDDIDGFLCIFKTGSANSHTTVFKNRTGSTRTMVISVFGGQA